MASKAASNTWDWPIKRRIPSGGFDRLIGLRCPPLLNMRQQGATGLLHAEAHSGKGASKVSTYSTGVSARSYSIQT
jgi:hypothetical protein